MSRSGFNRQLPRETIFSTATNRLKLPGDGAYLDNRAYDIIARTLKRARTI
jgi:hypothetical protein